MFILIYNQTSLIVTALQGIPAAIAYSFLVSVTPNYVPCVLCTIYSMYYTSRVLYVPCTVRPMHYVPYVHLILVYASSLNSRSSAKVTHFFFMCFFFRSIPILQVQTRLLILKRPPHTLVFFPLISYFKLQFCILFFRFM